MSSFRLFYRLLLFPIWTLLIVVPYLIISLLLFWSRPIRFRARCWMIGVWGKGLMRLVGMRVTVQGKPPPLPFMMVSNHLSYADIVLLIGYVPAWFISKSEVANWPVIGWLCKMAHALFINRASKKDLLRLNELIAERIERGEAVLFFPEGTSTEGKEVIKFKPSLLHYAAEQEFPVHTATISYQTPEGEIPARESVCWWGDAPFGPHVIGLLKLRSFQATLKFGEKPVINGDRKALAQACREDIASRFIPVNT